MIVRGIISNKTQSHHLKKADLTLKDALDIHVCNMLTKPHPLK